MNDDQIAQTIKSNKSLKSPIEMMSFIINSRQDLSQFEMIKCLKRIWPDMPFDVAVHASNAKIVVGENGIDNDHINELLLPRIKL